MDLNKELIEVIVKMKKNTKKSPVGKGVRFGGHVDVYKDK